MTQSALTLIVCPLAAAAMVTLSGGGQADLFEAATVTFIAYLLAGGMFRHEGQHTSLLPMTGALMTLASAVTGTLALVALVLVARVPDIDALHIALTGLVVAAVTLVGLRLLRSERRIRTVVIGTTSTATMLARELDLAGVTKYELVGVVSPAPDPAEAPDEGAVVDPQVLGSLHELGALVERCRIDLILMTRTGSRLAVFEEVAQSCLHLPVRLWELSGFYEDVFGHVPVAEINASWFAYIMHPRYAASAGMTKRVIDVVLASILAVLFAPLVLVLVLLIRRGGSPGLFRQTRIGEGGRPFTLYKLRTMRSGSDAAAQWASAGDPRVTRIGRLLRRTHLDEVPQLINISRGEMSLVGPRPEQPEFVERLEQTIPFYNRRHLILPGVTGWAQVRCGYAGSDTGSAWKLCHDLYYLKYSSFGLDLAILAETVRTLVADRQYGIEPAGVSFIMRAESPESLTPQPTV